MAPGRRGPENLSVRKAEVNGGQQRTGAYHTEVELWGGADGQLAPRGRPEE